MVFDIGRARPRRSYERHQCARTTASGKRSLREGVNSRAPGPEQYEWSVSRTKKPRNLSERREARFETLTGRVDEIIGYADADPQRYQRHSAVVAKEVNFRRLGDKALDGEMIAGNESNQFDCRQRYSVIRLCRRPGAALRPSCHQTVRIRAFSGPRPGASTHL